MVSQHKVMIANVQLLTGSIHGKIELELFQSMSLLFPPSATAECQVLSDVPSFSGKAQPTQWPQAQLSMGQQKGPPL